MIKEKPKNALAYFEGHPERWTKGRPYEDESDKLGIEIKALGWIPDRCCVSGALEFCDSKFHLFHELQEFIFAKSGIMGVAAWNDQFDRTHQQVVDMLRDFYQQYETPPTI